MWFIKWPWTRAPVAAAARDVRRHHPPDEAPSPGLRLLVEGGGGGDADAESTASTEHHHRHFPVEEPLHVEDGEAGSGSDSEGSSCDGEAVERGAAVRRGRRGRRHRRRRREQTGGGLPAFVAAVAPAAAVMLLALMALVALKRRQRRRGALDDDVPP